MSRFAKDLIAGMTEAVAFANGRKAGGSRDAPPSKRFNDLVQSRVARDPDFAAALLREGIDSKLTGDMDTGKVALHDDIEAMNGKKKTWV